VLYYRKLCSGFTVTQSAPETGNALMQTNQRRGRTYPQTDGNLAFASENLGLFQDAKTKVPHLRLVQHAAYDPQIEALFQANQIIAVIGMSITLCILWFLIVFILYRIARIAL